MKQIQSLAWAVFVSGLVLVTGCTSNIRASAPGEDRAVAVEEAREDMRKVAAGTLEELYRRQPQARKAVEGAAGYAVFSNFGMKILVAGGGSGSGIAVDNAPRREIFMRMAEVQAGLGFGIRKFRLVWVFETQAAFDNFTNRGFQLGAQATLAAQASGMGGGLAGAASVSRGVWVYQITDDGLAALLTIKGTRYFRDRELN